MVLQPIVDGDLQTADQVRADGAGEPQRQDDEQHLQRGNVKTLSDHHADQHQQNAQRVDQRCGVYAVQRVAEAVYTHHAGNQDEQSAQRKQRA